MLSLHHVKTYAEGAAYNPERALVENPAPVAP